MGAVFKLFKLQIDEIYNIFKGKNLKKLLFSLAKYAFFMFLLYMVTYSLAVQVFKYGFSANANLIAIVLLLTQVVALIFAAGNIISSLFLSKNNELLLSLPVSANELFLSKMLVIYVREVIVNSFYTVPLLLAIGTIKGFGDYYKFMMLPLAFVLPLLPLSVAAMLSIPLTKLLQVLKKHSRISIVILLSAVVAILVFYVNALSAIAEFDVGNKQLETVWKVNEIINNFGSKTSIFVWLANSLLAPSKIGYFFVYIALGAGCFIGALLFIRPFFFRAAMESQEDSYERAKAKAFKKQSPLFSLIKKELLTVFRSPGYVFQYFIFALLMPIIVLLYDRLLLSMDIVTKIGRMMIDGSHVIIVTMLAMLSNIISASAISREGGNFYIIKTSPINYYVQTAAKLLFNAMFSVSAILLTCVSTIISGAISPNSLSAGVIIATTIAAIFASIGHMCLSFDMDLKNPTLNWYDSGDITNVSTNTTQSLILALAISLFMGAFIIAFSTSSMVVVPWILLIGLSLGFCLHRIYILILRVSYQYERQEM